MTHKAYFGELRLSTDGDGDDILFLEDRPLAEVVMNDMESYGEYLTVRYWLSNKKETPEQMKAGFLKRLLGEGDAEYGHAYSEITGYLWTNEDLKVGGHDLIAELGSHAGEDQWGIKKPGKWCLLEIDYSCEPFGEPTEGEKK